MTFDKLIEKIKSVDTNHDCSYVLIELAIERHEVEGNQFDFMYGFLWGLRASKFITETDFQLLLDKFKNLYH